MRNLAVIALSFFCVAGPQFAWADNPKAAQSFPSFQSSAANGREEDGGDATAASQLQTFLKHLDIDMIANAHAAECKDEGEICKTKAECCSGLECTGDPQPTCRPEE